MTDIKSVLHLYLGCEVLCDDLYIFQLVGIFPSEVERGKIIACVKNPGDAEFSEFYIEEVKPILSRLSDMTEDDRSCFGWQDDSDFKEISEGQTLKNLYHAWMFPELLSKGYWLFGEEAFDKGLIIDKKTLH